jgi:hypothetical protein
MPQFRKRSSNSQRSDGLAAALFAGSPIERIAITVGTGVILFVMFLVYREAMRGLRPPAGRASRSSRIARLPGPETAFRRTFDDLGAHEAEQFLPNTWVPTASHYMRTSDEHTYCYFRKWTQESPKVLKFTPFAMISNRKGDKPGDQPYTVMSDTAYVTFKDEFKPGGKSPGAVVQAGLEGDVVITGPNNLTIRGRNFNFEREENRIYSDNLVEIHADKHKAVAKGIQIDLVADPKGKSDDGFSFTGVSTVKLLQNVEMTLVSSGDSQAGGLPGLGKHEDKGPRIVRTYCDGSFVFYVESRIATFDRNVRIRRETTPGKFDALFADENVEITFEPKKPEAKAPADPKKPPDDKSVAKNAAVAATDGKGAASGKNTTGGLESNLTFKSIHARGKIVELTSDANDLKSQMRDFTYDQTAREAKLVWIPRDTDRERTVRDKSGQLKKVQPSNCVSVEQRGNRLRSQKVQLNHDPQGEVTHVMCLGEGEMRHVEDKTGDEDLHAFWHKEMRKYPDPKSPTFDLIHLEEALIEQPKEGAGISANFIRLWITRQNRSTQTVHANEPPTSKQGEDAPHLDHMLAWQKVAMVSSQIECDTDHLEIWFSNAPGTARRSPGAKPRQRANLVPTSDYVARGAAPAAAAGVLIAPASPNGKPSPTSQKTASPKKTDAPKKNNPNDLFSATGSSDPYSLTAAKVRVHVIQGPEGQQPQLAYVLANDNVQLTQAHGDAAEPLVVNGNVLEVNNRGELDQEMVVLGQPAHVRDRGAHIEGGKIVFNRLRNTADVEGPGRLQLPVQQSGGGPEEEGVVRTASGEASQPLDVEWHQKMHFDGKTAHFFVNVHTSMTDAQSQSEIRCLNMDVTLTKPFSFTQQQTPGKPTPEADRPAIDTVFCQGDVEFESQATQGDHLAEVRRGQFMDLVFHKLTGKCTASGPGRLRVWRHTENGQSGISQFTNAQSNAPPKARKATAWEFEQVRFSGQMEGDFSDLMSGRARPKPKNAPKVQPTAGSASILASNGAWTTGFHNNVEVLYGPVDQPMELVSRDELSEDAGCLLCEYLQVTQRPQTEKELQHIEMLARGNAQIEGKTFRGEADTVTYDGSKTQYVLIGDSAGPARLWRQVKVGAPPGRNSALRIRFNPVTHKVIEEGTKELDQ